MPLNANQLLNEMLTRLSSVADSLILGFDELQHWPSGLLNTLEQSKLLVKDVQAQSLQCDGCEYGCFMPVVFAEDACRAFIVCDHPEQQEYMGRVAVNLSRLNQWRITTRQVASVVAKLLGFDDKPQYQNETANYTLGTLT
ncbi:MAG: hypothetical protein Q8L68_05605, partial [Methylococcales bacterium]|nr:hypothetical protein [Methylococcales bacterium]